MKVIKIQAVYNSIETEIKDELMHVEKPLHNTTLPPIDTNLKCPELMRLALALKDPPKSFEKTFSETVMKYPNIDGEMQNPGLLANPAHLASKGFLSLIQYKWKRTQMGYGRPFMLQKYKNEVMFYAVNTENTAMIDWLIDNFHFKNAHKHVNVAIINRNLKLAMSLHEKLDITNARPYIPVAFETGDEIIATWALSINHIVPSEEELRAAIAGNNLNIVKYLIEEYNLGYSIETLGFPLQTSNLELLDFLYENWIKRNGNLNTQNGKFLVQSGSVDLNYGISTAIINGKIASIDWCLKHNFDIKQQLKESYAKLIQRGKIEIAMIVKPYICDTIELTILWRLGDCKSPEMIEFYIKEGFKPDEVDLKRAINSGSIEAAKILFNNGARLSNTTYLPDTYEIYRSINIEDLKWLIDTAGMVPSIPQCRHVLGRGREEIAEFLFSRCPFTISFQDFVYILNNDGIETARHALRYYDQKEVDHFDYAYYLGLVLTSSSLEGCKFFFECFPMPEHVTTFLNAGSMINGTTNIVTRRRIIGNYLWALETFKTKVWIENWYKRNDILTCYSTLDEFKMFHENYGLKFSMEMFETVIENGDLAKAKYIYDCQVNETADLLKTSTVPHSALTLPFAFIHSHMTMAILSENYETVLWLKDKGVPFAALTIRDIVKHGQLNILKRLVNDFGKDIIPVDIMDMCLDFPTLSMLKYMHKEIGREITTYPSYLKIAEENNSDIWEYILVDMKGICKSNSILHALRCAIIKFAMSSIRSIAFARPDLAIRIFEKIQFSKEYASIQISKIMQQTRDILPQFVFPKDLVDQELYMITPTLKMSQIEEGQYHISRGFQ